MVVIYLLLITNQSLIGAVKDQMSARESIGPVVAFVLAPWLCYVPYLLLYTPSTDWQLAVGLLSVVLVGSMVYGYLGNISLSEETAGIIWVRGCVVQLIVWLVLLLMADDPKLASAVIIFPIFLIISSLSMLATTIGGRVRRNGVKHSKAKRH